MSIYDYLYDQYSDWFSSDGDDDQVVEDVLDDEDSHEFDEDEIPY